jgi:hypothetical protein
MWPKDMPADVETACQHPISKQIYLISGALYWKLERAAAGGACEWGMCAGYPKHIPLEWNWPIMQTPKADAALPPFSAWQYERLVVFATPAALWLLKGGLVWKILAASSAAQEDDLRLDPSPTYPLLMSQWKGWDEWSEKKIDVTVLATRSSPASSEQVDPRSYSSVSGPSVASAAPGVTVPVVATADCYALGHSFLFGRAHLPRDVERAVQIFRALARSRDHAASWCVLGCVQQLERGEAAAFAFTDDASQCFLRAAELGSLLGLSLVHEKGSGSFAKDARIARNFAHLAVLSDPSDAYACARLAGLLQQGSPAEMKDALALYERALSLGVDSVIEPMSLLLVSVQPPDMNRAMHMLTTMITDAGRRTAAIAALMQLLDEIRSQQASVEAQGQWTCVRCTLRNDPSSYACAACDADRPAEDNASSSSVADESKNDPSHRETSMVLTREILDKLRCADGIIDATGAEEVSQWKFDLKLDLSTLPPPSPLVPSSLNLFSSAAEFEQLYQRAFIVKSLPYYAYHRPSSLPLPSYSWSLPYDLRSFSQRERDCREEVEENAMKDEIRKLQELIPSNLRVHSHDLTPECLLGSGLSSEVWLSMFTGQKHLGSKFAVKAFQSSGAVSLPRRQLFDHFKHELEVYLSLDRERHPHLLQFYGVVLEEEAHDAGWIGAPRLEMKLLLQHMPRNSLATVLAEEKSNLKIDWSKPDRTNLRRLVGVLRECASALAFLHTRGLIHCDVAARNFLLDSHHTVRICDFGLARFLPRNPSFFARAPSKRGVEECGKMGFRRGGEEEVLPRLAMAPESLRENVKGTPYSRSTDIWSFGILTWQALSGRTAWNQQDWNAKQWPQLAGANGERCLVMAIAAGQLQLEPESHWPKSLQDLVAKCLHENPIMRETHAIFPKETRETKSGMHLIIEELTQIEKELSAA